jgi:hypothetical protein
MAKPKIKPNNIHLFVQQFHLKKNFIPWKKLLIADDSLDANS